MQLVLDVHALRTGIMTARLSRDSYHRGIPFAIAV
jgi:hypothetical protein